MSEYNARVITLEPAVLALPLAPGAAGPVDVVWSPEVLAVRLDGLPLEAAAVLKQAARTACAEAWISPEGGDEPAGRSVLLLVRRPQINLLLVQLDAAGWPDVAHAVVELLDNLDAPPAPLVCGPYTLPVGERTLLMGIVNMTPDSFSGDSLGD